MKPVPHWELFGASRDGIAAYSFALRVEQEKASYVLYLNSYVRGVTGADELPLAVKRVSAESKTVLFGMCSALNHAYGKPIRDVDWTTRTVSDGFTAQVSISSAVPFAKGIDILRRKKLLPGQVYVK